MNYWYLHVSSSTLCLCQGDFFIFVILFLHIKTNQWHLTFRKKVLPMFYPLNEHYFVSTIVFYSQTIPKQFKFWCIVLLASFCTHVPDLDRVSNQDCIWQLLSSVGYDGQIVTTLPLLSIPYAIIIKRPKLFCWLAELRWKCKMHWQRLIMCYIISQGTERFFTRVHKKWAVNKLEML